MSKKRTLVFGFLLTASVTAVATAWLVRPDQPVKGSDAALHGNTGREQARVGGAQRRASESGREAGLPKLPYSQAFEDCLYSWVGGNTAGNKECIEQESARWQKRLDAAYQKMLDGFTTDDREHPRTSYRGSVEPYTTTRVQFLRQAQADWLAYRAADCKAQAVESDGGTYAPVAEQGCLLDHLIERTLLLESLNAGQVPGWTPH